MKVGSLFSGIGGLDLGLERAGMTVVWQSEIDPYASRVLAKHWPHVPNLGDITTIDWSTVEPVDLICGGYPCQPFSLAGRRAGGNDARHLWPYFADAIRELRPRWALLENVPGHLSMGFGRVLGDLAELRYDADWQCVTAASVGAHHLRNRLFAVAHTSSTRPGQDTGSAPSDESTHEGRASQNDHVANCDGQSGGARDVADADSCGLARLAKASVGRNEVCRDEQRFADTDRRGHVADADSVARQTPEPFDRQPGTVGEPGAVAGTLGRPRLLGDAWAVEPDVGRVAYGVPSRVDRLKCLGNAVVPQVAEWVGRRIMEVAA